MRLVEHSDVFVENLKTSTLHQHGHPRERAARPQPPPDRAAHPAGRAHRRLGPLHRLRRPVRRLSAASPSSSATRTATMVETPATTYMDAATGPAGAFAMLAAPALPRATGRGQVIELAQSENVLNQLGDVVRRPASSAWSRRASATATRCGRPRASTAVAPTERWLAITVADDEEWQALAGAIGRRRPRRRRALRRPSPVATSHHDELDDAITGVGRRAGR